MDKVAERNNKDSQIAPYTIEAATQIVAKIINLALVKAGSDISIAPSFGNLNNALISAAALASAELVSADLLAGFLVVGELALGLAVLLGE